MLDQGFDVTSGTTQLGPVSRYLSINVNTALEGPLSSETSEEKNPLLPRSEAMMNSIVYLPISAETPNDKIEKMVVNWKSMTLIYNGRDHYKSTETKEG